jgi:hypothetical protein
VLRREGLDDTVMNKPIFIERDSLTGGSWGAGRAAPGADEAIATLRDAGYEVTVLERTADQSSAPTALVPAGSWLVTSDPKHCDQRPAGVRTILVGPRRPPGPRPTARCDVEARDLAAAVIEILTRDAMA